MASSRWFLALLAVLGDPPQLALELRVDLGAGVELLLGEEAGLDPLGELDLLLGVEQGDLADLLEVVLDRVGGGAGGGDLLGRGVVLVVVGEDEAGGLLDLLARPWPRGLGVVVGRLGVAVVRRPRRPARRPRPPGRCPRSASSTSSSAATSPAGTSAASAAFLAGRRPSWPRPSSPGRPRRRGGPAWRSAALAAGLVPAPALLGGGLLGGRSGGGAPGGGRGDGAVRGLGVERHVDALLLERAQHGLHALGRDLRLHERRPQVLAVHRADGGTDPHQLLQGRVAELGRQRLGRAVSRGGGGGDLRHERHRLPFVARNARGKLCTGIAGGGTPTLASRGLGGSSRPGGGRVRAVVAPL